MISAGTDFGTLLMPTERVILDNAVQTAWDDFLVTRILVSVSILLMILVLGDIFRIMPALMRCVSKYQGCISIEKNMQENRTRDVVLWACILPFALMIGRYASPEESLATVLPIQWRVPGIIVAIGAYEFLRTFFYTFFRYRGLNNDSARITKRNLRNFFIIASFIMFFTVCLFSVIPASDDIVRAILIAETVFIWMLCMVRQFQIFAPHHSRFGTFLYLCGLEFLPIVILVAILWAL